MTSGMQLIVHPAIAWVLMVPILGVDPQIARYGVLLAAMPAGINVYIFATYYNRAMDVAANTILLSTILSLFTITGWLLLLGA
jgi:predicted permease